MLEYSTFLGGVGSGGVGSIAFNSKYEIYLGLHAYGTQFAISGNAFQPSCEPDICGLIMKLNPTGQNILAATFFAGSGRSDVTRIAVSEDDSILVTGDAHSSDFPALNTLFPFVGGGADNQDVYLAKFSPDLRTLVYSTLIGGNGQDAVSDLTLDSSNHVYLVGGTVSDNFPVKNAFQAIRGGAADGFLLRLSDSPALVASPLISTPGQINLRYVLGGPPVAAQTIQLTGPSVPFTTSASAAWVTVLPRTGTAPATLAIGASPLVPGNYSATVTVTPAAGAPLNIPVSFMVLNPAPALKSVSPSFVPLLSDDTVVTFTGSGFTPQTQLLVNGNIWGPGVGGTSVVLVDGQTLQTTMPYLLFILPYSFQFSAVNPMSAASQTVTVSVGGATPIVTSVVNAASQLSGVLSPGELVQVNGTNFGPPEQLKAIVGGIVATVVFSTNTQALVVAPAQLQGTSAGVVLSTAGLSSSATTLPVGPTAPGVFTVDGSGVGQALINETAAPGSTITLFGTGGGDLSLPVTVSINGEDAPVTSVSAVADKPGWFQVVTTIPSDAPTDAPVTVILTVGGQSSQTGVTLALQGN